MIEALGYQEDIVSKLLGPCSKLVLATSYQNNVTARSISCIIINNKILFQTDRNFNKFHQIQHNPNVALCKDNIQIEGVAICRGRPFDQQNKEFLELYKNYYPNAYNQYSHLEAEEVIEVNITLITTWIYENRKPVRYYYDLKAKRFWKKYY